jgi:hypothetical protein
VRRLVPLVLLLALAGCGGSKHRAASSTVATTTAAPARAVDVTISAPRAVKANAKWPVVVRVTDSSGKPLVGTLRMNILFGGQPVGKVDNGKVWRFDGSWHEPKGQEITWPAQAKGQAFAFQAVVTVHGRTVKKSFPVTVR